MAAAGYSDLIGLVSNTSFQAESQLAVMKYAQYITGSVASFTARKVAWAYSIVNSGNTSGVAAQIANALIQDPIFTGQTNNLGSSAMLAAVTDAQFQAAVENAINVTILEA